MPQHLTASDPDFETRLAAFLGMKREVSADVDATVREIIAAVRARGDEAIADFTRRFDRLDLTAVPMRVSADEVRKAVASVDAETLNALKLARDRIASHHARQKPADDTYTDALGVTLGSRWTAVEAAGLYVPGGTAAYPSSVLMNAVPAGVAGVERIVMVVPSPDGVLNPLVLAAADLAGVAEIYRIGGAQAVAALAYGGQRLVEIAITLGQRPTVLLLDEPAAGVPSTESHLLLDLLETLPDDIAILIIEHDMDVVFRFAERVTVLVDGAVLVEDTPANIAENADVRAVYLGERRDG